MPHHHRRVRRLSYLNQTSCPYHSPLKYCAPYRMQYEDRSASGFSRRKAQKAIASFYTPANPPVSVDASVLTTLRQGQQTIMRTPITTVCGASEPIPRNDPGCCCLFPPVTITNVRQNQNTSPVQITVTWIDDPNAVRYNVAVHVVEGFIDTNNPPLFEEPGRTSVVGSLGPTVERFKIGIIAKYPCGDIISWTDEYDMTGSAP